MKKENLSVNDLLAEVEKEGVDDSDPGYGGKKNVKDRMFEEMRDIQKLSLGKKKPINELVQTKNWQERLYDRNIVWLNEIGKKDIPIGGGKGANLAEMYNMKLPVPPAFIITANTFKNFIESTGLNERINSLLSGLNIEDTATLESNAAQIREMMVKEEMPRALMDEIKSAYVHLDIDREIMERASTNVLGILKTAREPVFVAVRSSATTEDLDTASFAGQQETFLNIKGTSNLIEAVKKCWASLFTARAVYYRQKRGFAHNTAYVAVIVQKMINSDKSGVMFTLNPATNNRDEIVIEAAFGLGEGIVSGAVAPDYYSIDKATMKPTAVKVATKNIYITKSSSGETVKKPLSMEKARERVLEFNDLMRLASYGKQLEEHYGIPQDIEWGMEYNKIFILQTRPVTTYKNVIKSEEVNGEVIIEGLGASPGIAAGIVRVIQDFSELSKVQAGDVIVTKMTNPDMVVTMQRASAIVTDEGGMTAHAAIVSRELGIPCVVGTERATALLHEGDIVTVDGSKGKIFKGRLIASAPASSSTSEAQAPAPQALSLSLPEESDEEKLLKDMEQSEMNRISAISNRTNSEIDAEHLIEEVAAAPSEHMHRTETVTRVYMNLGQPDKIDVFKTLDFDGIGLMRLEFMIASKIRKHPLHMIALGQQEQYINSLSEGISKVAASIYPRPIVVRFSDLKSNEYKGLEGGEKYEMLESNPMIGFRGVSRYVSEQFEQAFRLECRAIAKARERLDNIYVMLPFVRETGEVVKCLKILESENLVRGEKFKIWLMAEVPSMAFIPEEFAKLGIDGVSIGSNDLTQLVLGVDRDSGLLGKMGYFNERNKAVLVAMHNIISGFKKHGKTVSICGQAPSVYPEMIEFLVKQGIDSISVNPDSVASARKRISEAEKRLLLEAVREKSSNQL